MLYDVTIGETRFAVEVRPLGESRFEVLLDGTPVPVEPVVVPGGLLLDFGGRVVDVVLGGADAAEPFLASGALRVRASVESERRKALRARRRSIAQDGGKAVESPMHGRVVKVLVAPGDEVAAGQPVVVVEAMKMENEIRATSAGAVSEIRVAPGDNVEIRTVLVVLS